MESQWGAPFLITYQFGECRFLGLGPSGLGYVQKSQRDRRKAAYTALGLRVGWMLASRTQGLYGGSIQSEGISSTAPIPLPRILVVKGRDYGHSEGPA